MSIDRVPFGNSLPTVTQDYVDQNNLLAAGLLDINEVYPVDFDNDLIPEGVTFSIGGTLYKTTGADEPITGTPSKYVRITPSGGGATDTAAYVANLTGVTWSNVYNHYEDVSGNLYLFDEGLGFIEGDITDPKTRFGKSRGIVLESLKVDMDQAKTRILYSANSF